jgi:hypothetical protein
LAFYEVERFMMGFTSEGDIVDLNFRNLFLNIIFLDRNMGFWRPTRSVGERKLL